MTIKTLRISSTLIALAALCCAQCSTTEGSCKDSGPGTAKRGLCEVRPLTESDYCGDSGKDCVILDELGSGCSVSSRTEQVCDSCTGGFVRVVNDDAVELYFDDKNELAAVKRIDQSEDGCEAWYGLDLTDCVAVEEPKRVECRQ